ncbi:MAG TPA: NUDIX domain-containing protein, partial [Deinococcales bacterium]|nr:NUDIX domain-containing protein [Deinococcales bacterium]
KPRPVVVEVRAVALLAASEGGRFLFCRRPPGGTLGGLDGVPLAEVAGDALWDELDAAAASLAAGFGLDAPLMAAGEARHSMSHRRYRVSGFAARVPDGWTPTVEGCGLRRPEAAALSRLDEKLLALAGWKRDRG